MRDVRNERRQGCSISRVPLMTEVTLRSVSKTFGGRAAVSDVSLNVQHGEFVVLLGPSGCGKTTTLRMIAGFEHPSAGEILLGGKNVTGLAPRLRNIGMVFQNYALFPHMTVAQNIGFSLKQRRVDRKKIAARVDELLDLIQLSGRAQDFCTELSGGQQQRVALARALSFSPQVLLMDEPLGALDQKLREAMQVELRRIQQELRITTILVTHDQHEAMTLADRIVIMSEGKIQQIGEPDTLYHRPANRFVADFIGKNNILRGEIVASRADGCTIRIESEALVEFSTPAPPGIGPRIEVGLRPERLRLVEACSSAEGNVLAGTVHQKHFLGSVENYFVRLAWGQTVLAERPTGGPSIGIGARVHVHLDLTEASLFDASTGSR
jgi:spermidine/putrescine ABC transporter ATP-binding subunit